MRYLLYLCCSLIFIAPAFGQTIGLHPPTVDWQQINTDTVRVIFPVGYEAQAQRVTHLIHQLQRNHRRSIGDQYFKFDLILQTETTTPNAYVGLAPFRSEFFTTPPQSFNLLGLTDWNDLLSIHEFRHVQQASNERRGITKLFSILQGQLGWSVFANIATPNWFAEGDAVIAETALTTSGRGRMPSFSRELRALEHEGLRYSYAKTRNGSFRHRVPSHYPYGYFYTTYVRNKFGNDIWADILADGAAFKPLLYSFSGALKKRTGLSTPALYTTTMEDLASRQQATLAKRTLTETKRLSPDHREPAEYLFPHPQADSSIIAYRNTFIRTPELIRVLPSGKVVVLTDMGFQREPYLDVRDGLAVWTEIRQDPRYTNRNYSDIILYEIGSGRKRKLTQRGKYLSPSLSPDRRTISAVKYHPATGANIVLLSTVSGEEMAQLPNPEGWYLAWPVFSADQERLYALATRNGEVAIVAQDLDATAGPKALSEFSSDIMDMLTLGPDGWLYFSGSRDGIDNIYAFDPATGQHRRCTSIPVGAYYPGVGPAERVVFSETNSQGHHLSTLVDPAAATSIPLPEQSTLHYLTRPEAWEAEGGNMLNQQFKGSFPVTDISDHFGGLNLHSWSYNGDFVVPGVEVAIENALNTAAISADVDYNFNEKRTSGGLTFTYGGFFPVLSTGVRYRDRSTVVQDAVNFPDSLVFVLSKFSQIALNGQASVPLRWLSGNYRTNLVPIFRYEHLFLRGQPEEAPRLEDNFGSLGGALIFNTTYRQARRQVQPRLGLALTLQFDRAGGSNRLGQRFQVQSSAFLPGLLHTHGLRIDLGYQREQLTNPYQYPDGFRYVRGYSAPINDDAYRIGFNYQFPLLYPDFGIAGITYFQRIRVNAFYDTGGFGLDFVDARQGSGSNANVNFSMRSTGAEIFFDNSWLNAQDLTVGVQLAYLLERDLFAPSNQSRLQFQLLFEGLF